MIRASGPRSPATVVSDASVGTRPWDALNNAKASDNASAYADFMEAGQISQYLKATDFGFEIPDSATVLGIQVDVERRSISADAIRDYRMHIVKGGVIGDAERADTVNNWPTSDTYKSYGGPNDRWGAIWSPADINGSGFGMALSTVVLLDDARFSLVDHVRITVHYKVPVTAAAIVSVHDDSPPYPMLAEFVTAHDIDRLLPVTGAGNFSFSVAANDPQANRDTLCRGLVVAIRSTVGLPPYVGYIETLEHDLAAGVVEVGGDSLARVLYHPQLPLDCSFENQAAGAIAMQLLRLANSTNATGIWPSPHSEPGTPVRGTFDASGSKLGDALDDLAGKTGDEWWVEATVTRRGIEAYLRWARERGTDRSAAICLREGLHFTGARYVLDAQGVAQSVTVIGGGQRVADRPAAGRALAPSALVGKATVIEGASEAHRRGGIVPPTLAQEAVEYAPLDEDEAVLSGMAQRMLERPAMASESFDLTINHLAPWDIVPGDIVRAILPSAYFGGINRKVRILALQPDEETGELDLAVQVEGGD